MMKVLTKHQARTYASQIMAFVGDFFEKNGRTATPREIAEGNRFESELALCQWTASTAERMADERYRDKYDETDILYVNVILEGLKGKCPPENFIVATAKGPSKRETVKEKFGVDPNNLAKFFG